MTVAKQRARRTRSGRNARVNSHYFDITREMARPYCLGPRATAIYFSYVLRNALQVSRSTFSRRVVLGVLYVTEIIALCVLNVFVLNMLK